MNPTKIISSVGLLAVTLVVGASGVTPVQPGQQSSQGFAPPARDDTGGVGKRQEVPIGMLGVAASLEGQGVETVISAYNDSGVTQTIRVEWLYDLGGANHVAGESAALTIDDDQSLEFSTSNYGETNWPFFNNSPRATSRDFVGRAIIYADPGGRGVSFEACRLSGLDIGPNSSASALQHVNVYRVKSSGIARQAGD